MKKSLRLLTLIFFSFAMPLFAETYYWAGGGADTNWTTVENWRTESETGAVATAYPTTGDTAYIAGNYTVTIDEDITVAALNIQKSGAAQYVGTDWTTKLTGTKKITFGAMDFNRASSTGGVIGTLEIDCEAECTGTLYTHSGTKLLVDGGNKLTAAALTHSATNSIPKSLVQVDGTLQAGTIDLQGDSNVGCNALKVTSGGTVTAASLTWSTNDNYTNTDYPAIDNAGTITLSGNLNATGPVSNTETLKTTGGTLTFKSSVANTETISAATGGVTFAGAVAGASGTIITTTGNITTSAAAASSLGTVQSSGGTISNSGSGALTLAELQMGADTSVTNSTGGALTITKLTGNRAATLTGGTNAITVSSYDGSPTIAVTAGSCALGTGTIAALTVSGSAETAVAGNLTVTGTTTNDGTISVGANSITFAGAVDSASGTVTMTTGGVTVSGGSASAFGTVQCAGGAFTNSGSGSTTVADFAMSDNSVVTNSASGTLVLTKLSGAYNATIKSVSADNGMTINSYDAATKIAVAASSKNILLAGGTLDSLVINGGSKATVNGDITTTNGITNSGTLATSAAVAITGPVTNGGTISAAANDITFNGAVTGAGGTITTTTGNITTSAAATSYLGTVQSAGGELTNSGAGAVTVAELSMGAATTVANTAASGGIAVAKLSGGYTATLNNASATENIAINEYADNPTIKAAAGSSSLGGGTLAALTVDAGATATVSGALIVTGDITNNGTLDASANLTFESDFNGGSGTFSSTETVKATGMSAKFTGNNANIANFVYDPSGGSGGSLEIVDGNKFTTEFSCATPAVQIKLSGANTIGTLAMTSAGGTLTVNDAQTINGDLSLEGADGSLLNVTGGGSLGIGASQSKEGKFLNVDWDNISISGTGYYIAKDSEAASTPNYGQKSNWIILNPLMEFVWTGIVGNWNDPLNWNYNLVPGLTSATGGVSTVGYSVKIPNDTSKPTVSDAINYSIKNLAIDDPDASLTFSSSGNVAVSGTLANKGKIFYSDAGRVTNETGTFINDDTQGTVEFNGSGAADLANVQYHDLIVSGSGDFLSAEDKTLTVKNDMTYNASAASGTLTISALSVTNDLKILAGNVKFNASDVMSVGTETKAKTVTLSTSGSVSVGNNGADRFNVTDGALNFLSSLGDLELCGKITASGGITLSKDATLKGNVDFESDTTLGADVNLIIANDHSSMQTATTNAKLVCAGHTLTLKNASLTNNGAVTDGNINFIETAARAQLFTPNTGSTYAKVTVNKTSGGSLEIKKALKATEFTITENKTFTADAAFTAEKLAITKNTNATFNGLATISSEYSDAGTAGNISFAAGCSFTPATTFNTTGSVTLNGSSTACNFTGGLTHTTGPTTLNGALTTENNKDISLAATTLAAAATIDAGAGAVTINGSLDGLFAFASNGTGTLTLAGAVGTTNPPATITVEGQTIISAPSVKTSGLQNYKKDVTFDAAACAVTGEIKADANLIVNAGKAASLSSATTVAGDINNNGTLAATGNFTFESDFNGGSGTFSSTATVTSTGAAATFTGNNAEIANFVYVPSGSSGGSLEIVDGNRFTTEFSCATPAVQIKLSGANTIGTLAMASAGGTLTVNDGQTITALTLQGADGSPLNVEGSGSLNITSSQQSGNYLSVALAGPKISNDSGDAYYSAKNSSFDGDPYYGQHNHWIIMNKLMVFEWAGGDSVDWGRVSNWNYKLVPGLASTIGGVDTRGYPVIISNSPAKTYLPATAAAYSVGQLTINDAAATLTLASADISLQTFADRSATANGTLANKGTINYSNAGRIRVGTTFINDASATNKGTVDFTGTSGATDLATPSYYNLIVSGTGNFSAGSALTVENDLTYSSASGSLTLAAATIKNDLIHSGGGVLTTNGAVAVQNDLTQIAGTLTANANLTVTNALAVNAGTASFNAETEAKSADFTPATSSTVLSISLGNTEGDKFTLTGAGSSLILPAELTSLSVAGTITAGGGITISHNAVLNNNTILANATTIGAPVIVSTNPAASNYTLTTSDTLATSAALTIQDANLVNTGAVTNGNISFTETAARAQSFTPNESSTYTSVEVHKEHGGSLEIKSAFIVTDFTVTKNGKLTTDAAVTATNFKITDNVELVADAAVTAAKLTITKNTNATFKGLVTVSSEYSDAGTAGNITFDKGCSYTFADKANFITTGTLTLNGTDNPCAFKGGLEHTSGLTILYTALNTTSAAITLGATTLAADTTINAGTGTVSLGALDGAFDFTNAGSGTLTFKGSVGAAAKLATITVTKKTIVQDNAAYIKTTGLQTYNDDITFMRSCAVDGQIQAAASIATNGDYTVTFTKDVNLFTSNPATLGGYGGKLLISGDIYFAVSGKTSTVASTVQAKNVLLFQGEISIAASGELISTQDIILLGAKYNIDDKKETTASQVTGLFAYNHASRQDGKHSPALYTKAFPSAPYSGIVTTTAGAKIKAGKNFYANGLNDDSGNGLGSDLWTLTLPDNNLQTAAFAEIYNSEIYNCSSNYDVAAAEGNNIHGSCSKIITTRPVIDIAYTVYDDVIYISFKDSAGNSVKIENSNNEISAAVSHIFNSAGYFAGTYTDADCQTSTNNNLDRSDFYIKSNYKWNTDAIGTNKGAAASTDRSGSHQETIPYLNLPKALTGVYETLRDSSKNRITHYYNTSPDTSAQYSEQGKTFTAVADQCEPVLIKVLTGQEMHEAPASQKEYDAHNFVEFVYSEPVDINGSSTTVAASDVNIHAAGDLGATTNSAGGITFAYLASTSSGSVNAALKTGSGSPHSLYRNFSDTAGAAPVDHAARIRVSIAGYVDGTFSVGGDSYNNWTGYISSAATPSGTITRIANTNIKDKSPAQKSLTIASTTGHPLPTITIQNSGASNELYGLWDVTPPSFAPVRINGTSTWNAPAYDGSQEFEFVGASYGTGTLSAIEVHWFDNEPKYNEATQWFSRVGWATASSATEYNLVQSYAADVRGGSRADSGNANVTVGGIRYSSIYNANNAFEYAIYGSESYVGFSQQIKGGAESSLFTYGGSDTGAATNPTGAEDGLYTKLLLDNTLLQPNTTFTMTFDSNACFITDLAGNRIQCGKIKMKSIDRTPPEFLMSAVPLGSSQMLVIFSKSINIGTLALYTDATTHDTVSALEYIPKALEFKTISGGAITEIKIEDVPAKCVFRNNKATGIVLTLSKNAVLDNVTSGIFISAKKSDKYKYDPLSGIDNAHITYIQDAIGNYVVADSKHAFSDFAVNAINPQYAYDNSLTDEGVATSYGLYQEGVWAVRDWNAEQKNSGTISANKEIIMQTTLYDGSKKLPSGQKISAVFDSAPDFGSVSTKINENTKMAWRIWHPNLTSDVFTSLAPINNIPQFTVEGNSNDTGVVFDIEKSLSSSNWKNGDQVSFLFKMGDYTVDHYADGRNFPLYAVRLKDISDITSLDLWSFKIRTTTLQRGGVTILNNVIDLNNGEHTVVEVDMKESGNLNVMVMTLDGNIVTYLRHGYTEAGSHYYNWNGTNNGGSKVARGLYFVRVIGPGIDETRKVMCVK
ncbi:MAG: hypothetical protein J6V90_07465 [Treponema sp.]|nr:hypothetical protein [Treponema sp.]